MDVVLGEPTIMHCGSGGFVVMSMSAVVVVVEISDEGIDSPPEELHRLCSVGRRSNDGPFSISSRHIHAASFCFAGVFGREL
jgi:hypothetical protein